MRDPLGRRIEYLRISVTDKCNLRCVYCMPLHGLPWLRREQLLSYEEIRDIVATMAGMGLRRVRITGGEPRFLPVQAKKGDYALFFRRAAVEITFQDRKYLVVPQAAILVLLRGTSEPESGW